MLRHVGRALLGTEPGILGTGNGLCLELLLRAMPGNRRDGASKRYAAAETGCKRNKHGLGIQVLACGLCECCLGNGPHGRPHEPCIDARIDPLWLHLHNLPGAPAPRETMIKA